MSAARHFLKPSTLSPHLRHEQHRAQQRLSPVQLEAREATQQGVRNAQGGEECPHLGYWKQGLGQQHVAEVDARDQEGNPDGKGGQQIGGVIVLPTLMPALIRHNGKRGYGIAWGLQYTND
eukprot:1137203-Pelagomonas_calceolata.AAC.3